MVQLVVLETDSCFVFSLPLVAGDGASVQGHVEVHPAQVQRQYLKTELSMETFAHLMRTLCPAVRFTASKLNLLKAIFFQTIIAGKG